MKYLALLCAFGIPLFAETCDKLTALALPHVTIVTASEHSGGDIQIPGVQPLHGVSAFCRVAGVSRPSSDSEIGFEIWLPANWNGKFQGVGNGGYAGNMSYTALASAVSHGYAAAATDTGHKTASGAIDATWALHHPEKIADFGYRSIHETATTAKAVIRAFYGSDPKHSYFNACSTGGRQALMEAQRFPADYDGIISGAPANDWSHLLSTAANDAKATLANPASYISAAKLPAIQAAALSACDAKDGVKDGVIEDPRQCRYDPSILLCKGAETPACLTAPQLTALKTLYGGLRGRGGKQLFPGYSPGGEAETGGWIGWITGPAPEKSSMFLFGTQFFQNMVYDNPAWDFRSFDPDRDTAMAGKRPGDEINATNPDLSAFEKRGGKLILFHGWADAAIPALNSIRYYESVEAKMGNGRVAQFARLYMVPGMEHCNGGVAPDQFGQNGVPRGDRFHDIDAALEAWVEQGLAPDRIVATKYKAGGAASGVARTRPLCPYPQTARWSGTGSTDDAANFTCRK